MCYNTVFHQHQRLTEDIVHVLLANVMLLNVITVITCDFDRLNSQIGSRLVKHVTEK